jgi:hypothetical protein
MEIATTKASHQNIVGAVSDRDFGMVNIADANVEQHRPAAARLPQIEFGCEFPARVTMGDGD